MYLPVLRDMGVLKAAEAPVLALTGLLIGEVKELRDTKPDPLQYGSYMSNLPLQLLMYFECFYFPIWLITFSFILNGKFDELDPVYRVLLVAIVIVMCVVETVRLYLGYMGNLVEMVPELAGSWILTIILMTPLTTFLLFNDAALIQPMERIITAILFVFVVLESVFGYVALRDMTREQVRRFNMRGVVSETNEAYAADQDDEALL